MACGIFGPALSRSPWQRNPAVQHHPEADLVRLRRCDVCFAVHNPVYTLLVLRVPYRAQFPVRVSAWGASSVFLGAVPALQWAVQSPTGGVTDVPEVRVSS